MTGDIFEITQTALNTLAGIPSGVDVMLNDDGTVPDTYLVYDLIGAPPAQHMDNEETARTFKIQVSIYSRNDYTTLPDVDGAMKAAGFSRGDWRFLPFVQDTQHHGLAKDYTILLES